MATVSIGGRELAVRKSTLGFLRHELIPARKALASAEGEEAIVDAMAHMLFVYLGHNDGVTLEWIFENAPAESFDLIRECVIASGQKVKGQAQGEAARP